MLSIEKAIELIINDEVYHPDTAESAFCVKIAFLQAHNSIMRSAALRAINIMTSYRMSGVGDDVYMSELVASLNQLEKAFMYSHEGGENG